MVASAILMFTPQVQAIEVIQPIPIVEQSKVEVQVIKTEYSKEDIYDIVASSSATYGYKTEDVMKLISCETGGTFDTNLQSRVIQPYGRELSFGLAQIHIPSHPSITVSQAKDPYFAVEFIGKHWSDRNQMWLICTKKLQI